MEAAINGEETLIAKAGKPVAKFVPINLHQAARKFGILKGKIKISKDFDAPLPEDIIKILRVHNEDSIRYSYFFVGYKR